MLRGVIVCMALAMSPDRAVATPCDGETLEHTGDEAFAAGLYAKALASFELALRCMPTVKRVTRAIESACALHKRNQTAALREKIDRYLARLPAGQRAGVAHECLHAP